MHLYGLVSPRRGSRKRERWGVVALGEVAGKERHTEINRTHKKPTTRNPVVQIQYIYETPKILRSIFSTDSCLQSDNGVSTSNTQTDVQIKFFIELSELSHRGVHSQFQYR